MNQLFHRLKLFAMSSISIPIHASLQRPPIEEQEFFAVDGVPVQMSFQYLLLVSRIVDLEGHYHRVLHMEDTLDLIPCLMTELECAQRHVVLGALIHSCCHKVGYVQPCHPFGGPEHRPRRGLQFRREEMAMNPFACFM